MGNYTSLYFDATLTEEGFRVASTYYWARVARWGDRTRNGDRAALFNFDPIWKTVAEEWRDRSASLAGTLEEFARLSRSDHIPCGVTCPEPRLFGPCVDRFTSEGRSSLYPDEPARKDALADEDFDWGPPSIGKLDAPARRWTFSTSLKSYEGEVEFFLRRLAPLLCETVHRCWILYDGQDNPLKMDELFQKG